MDDDLIARRDGVEEITPEEWATFQERQQAKTEPAEKTTSTSNGQLTEFPLFAKLSAEVRGIIWNAAMRMENPRMIESQCPIYHPKGYHRQTESTGLTLDIEGTVYENVPAYFFVNTDSRFYALRFYTIRFSIHQYISYPHPRPEAVRNVLMSENDILVTRFTEPSRRISRVEDTFSLAYGPGAARIKNIMVGAWTGFNRTMEVTCGWRLWHAALCLVVELGNLEKVQNVFLLCDLNKGANNHLASIHRCDMGDGPDNISILCKKSTMEVVPETKYSKTDDGYVLAECTYFRAGTDEVMSTSRHVVAQIRPRRRHFLLSGL